MECGQMVRQLLLVQRIMGSSPIIPKVSRADGRGAEQKVKRVKCIGKECERWCRRERWQQRSRRKRWC